MFSLILNLILFFGLILFFSPSTLAAENQFITVVFPVRGADFFQLEGSKPLDNVEKQWQALKERNLPATWLLRPDNLFNQRAVDFFKRLPFSQELGLFMEVTPTWSSFSQVQYHQNLNWHDAGSVFLTGYGVDERQKLIDSAFEKFKKEFGYFPKSVGAWWIDALSLSYMREKYGILVNMDVADQYSTDNYQVWGQYFSTPFYPAKRNALVPASGEGQKIGVVTIQWATRDPYNSFGNGVLDSTYSVQANDYSEKEFHSLNADYFKKLLSIYLDNPYSNFGQVTVGLENDFEWSEFGDEFIKQLDVVKDRQSLGTQILTLSQFSTAYKALNPGISPPQIIFADDPLGSGNKVLWYQNFRYRVGWFQQKDGSVIRDLRLFRESIDEPCLQKACSQLNLAMQETKNLDEVTFGDRWVIDEGKISDVQLDKISDGLKLIYKNQAGVKRVIQFLPNDIKVDSSSYPLPVAIDQAISASRNIPKIEHKFEFKLANFSETILNQVKNLLIFLFFSIFMFYLPGLLLLQKLDLSVTQKFILSWPVGIALFTLLSFILGYLKIPWAVLILSFAATLILRKNIVIPKIEKSKEFLLATLAISLGSFSWLLTSFKNGLQFDFGLGFWGPHGHDGIWHLSLIESLKSGLPPQNPIFAGEVLQNYHYFYDLLLSQASNLTKIEAVDLYFRLFPLLISLLIGAVAYILAKRWFNSSIAATLSCFFLYFGGSFGWILSYIRNRSLGGESTFWAQQGISTLINPPFAVSILIFLAGLYLFHKIIAQKDQLVYWIIPLTILWGSLIEFKAYAGILVLTSLAVVTLFELLKKNPHILKISLPTFVLSMIVFLPQNSQSSTLLVFSPLWLVHSMVDFPDRLNWGRLALTRMTGYETGNLLKILAAEGLGVALFLVGNLGARVVGFLSLKKLWSFNSFGVFLSVFLLTSIVFPLFFIQQGANFNTIQFFYYFLLVFNFLAAKSFGFLIDRWKKIGWAIVVFVIFMTLPTTWDTLQNYLPKRPPAMVSTKELEALNFLKSQPKGVVLSYFYNKKLNDRFIEPRPLFAYESTAYVGVFSAKSEFISDTVNLEILGVDYKGRLQTQKDILKAVEPEVFKKMLRENKISYLYTPKFFKFSIDNEKYGIKRIFENEEVEIFKVNQ